MPPKPKDTGLAAFTDEAEDRSTGTAARRRGRTKAKGEIVHVTLRLTHDEWERAHQLARMEGCSLNELAIMGISRILKEKGLPEL
jgi:hypothetical protein